MTEQSGITRLERETALRAVRTLADAQLPELPTPLGFRPRPPSTTRPTPPLGESHAATQPGEIAGLLRPSLMG